MAVLTNPAAGKAAASQVAAAQFSKRDGAAEMPVAGLLHPCAPD